MIVNIIDMIAAIIGSIASLIAALVSIALVYIAKHQLIGFRRDNISREINQAKKTLNDIALYIKEKSLNTSYDETHVIILEQRYDAAVEDYLNSLDNLAHQILKNGLPEKELKSDYQGVIIDTVKLWKEHFTITTPYNNLQKLYEKWKI